MLYCSFGIKSNLKKVFIKCGNHSLVHAKLYLIHSNGPDNPPLSIVGSSNLTSNGLARPNELNVDFLDHDACNKLQAWFNQRWDEREDMSERVIERIDKHLKVDGCD